MIGNGLDNLVLTNERVIVVYGYMYNSCIESSAWEQFLWLR